MSKRKKTKPSGDRYGTSFRYGTFENNGGYVSKKYRRYKHLVFKLGEETFTLSLDGRGEHNEQDRPR